MSPFWMLVALLGLSFVLVRGTMAEGNNVPSETKFPSSYYGITESSYSLIGTEVRNLQGIDLGTVASMTFNDQGHVTFVILDPNLPQLKNRHLAIPFTSLNYEPNGVVTLDISKDMLARAPSFGQDKWPSEMVSHWAQDTSRYFGQAPPFSE